MADGSPTSNPAARLLRLLNRSSGEVKKPDQQTVQDVWMAVLGVLGDLPPSFRHSTFLRRYSGVVGLPADIRRNVAELHDEDQGLLLEHMGNIETAFLTPLQHPWAQFARHIGTAEMFSLKVISDRLNRRMPEVSLQREHLTRLSEAVGELDDLIRNSDIDSELHSFLRAQAGRMRRAISDVGTHGAESLKSAAEGVVGAIVIHRALHGEPKSTEERTLLAKMGTVASSALTMCNLVAAPFNVAIAAQTAIGTGDSPSPVVIELNEAPELPGDDVAADG